MQAWSQYIGGDPTGTLPKLRTLARDDPLSALGVILADVNDPARKDRTVIEAHKLINDHPSGVIGAVLWAELSRFHQAIDPAPSSAAIATLVSDVPNKFMELLGQPKSFYQVQVTPLKAAYQFAEPILVRVSMQNIGDLDLAIGNDCEVRPELWFDAFLRGMLTKGITGAAIGRLDQRLVLAPGDVVSTVVRIDQDALYPYFNNNPNLDLIVNLTLVTNPTQVKKNQASQSGQATPGVCGYAVQASDLIARSPFPIETEDQRFRLLTSLDQADGGEKIRLMQVVAVYIGILRVNQNPAAAPIATSFLAKLHRVQTGGLASVQAWQKLMLATLATGDDKAAAINADGRGRKLAVPPSCRSRRRRESIGTRGGFAGRRAFLRQRPRHPRICDCIVAIAAGGRDPAERCRAGVPVARRQRQGIARDA